MTTPKSLTMSNLYTFCFENIVNQDQLASENHWSYKACLQINWIQLGELFIKISSMVRLNSILIRLVHKMYCIWQELHDYINWWHFQKLGPTLQSVSSPTADPGVKNLIPAGSHTFVEILIMKYFLEPFSSFCWFKKGCCQFQAKVCAQSTG